VVVFSFKQIAGVFGLIESQSCSRLRLTARR